ncbi:MAG: molybdopterin-binding/glycosyltransferase family 2 protein [Proteobacteria bacterium]|nr:molybdopterin-binding/glycosyltransferase family 2 protein [Pseudomonadota bacterium]
MKFGPIPAADAAHAILAHTLRLPDGAIFKKGRVLAPEDCEALVRAGHDTVTAVRLDPDDMAENQAAAQVARAAGGAHVRVAEAFTGRANLFAETRGLAAIDRARIDALNAIDQAVTVATVPVHARVDAGDMVATVKIIPFAVSRQVIEKCAATLELSADPASGESGRAVAVRPLARHRPAMVLTRLPGVKESILDRASGNMQTRLHRLGNQLEHQVRCAHDSDAVADAVRDLLGAGYEPILILGASAIADRHDVIPSGIEKAGGVVDHFGMPVDPGNLLLLAHTETPTDAIIVGVPGCARSLKASGFDWVLERVLAGIAVSSGQIMAMGVGGLLADIASRGQPRHRSAGQSIRRPELAAVVLAGGQSRRMGAQNKLLARVAGKPMVARVVDALVATPLDRVVVVTGHESDLVRAALAGRPVEFVYNPDHAEGMSTSLAAGVAAIETRADAVLVCLGDMPWIRPDHVQTLIDAFNPVEGRAICVPVYQHKPGNPVLFAADFFPAMKSITGDMGARHIIRDNAELVHHVAMNDSSVLLDLDTADALAAVQMIDSVTSGDPTGRDTE